MTLPPPESSSLEPSAGSFDEPRRKLLEATLGSQYEIIRLLGEGGAGTVYLARERLLERLVAIKVLRRELVTVDARERFVREARTAARLMQTHIVPLYSFGEVGETLYYIMGYVEGESLESMLRRGVRSDPNETRRILVEIAEALDYAHRNGVIHRDVKPDNVMIERESRRAILTDFGIAKTQSMQSTLTRTGVVVGTPHYMSPEQASGDQVDGRSDLYSLGVIGYRMLSGRLPFEGSSVQEILAKHITQSPDSLAGVAPNAPADMAWAITRCLDKDPTRRWPTVESFRQALEIGDESAADLPEPLERLSGRATQGLVVAWFFLVLGLSAWARTSDARWLAIAVIAIAAAGAWTATSFAAARAFGLTRPRAWRLLGASPERWSGWWPSSLRRSGDVWDQLPASVRNFRLTRSVFIVVVAGFLLPVAAVLALAGGRLGLSINAIGAATGLVIAGFMALLLSLRSSAVAELHARNVQSRLIRRWLTEPTWSSGFWRRSENSGLLTPAPAHSEVALDTASSDSYSVGTPTQSELPHGMFDHVDPRSPTPLYAQIASRLRVAIASGELKSGDGLPSVRQLASRLRINPATVVQAYRELEVEGLVTTRHGAGTFVQEVAADRRHRDREQEARRLVRTMLADAASMGITGSELRAAMEEELKASTRRPSGSDGGGGGGGGGASGASLQ